MRAWVIYFLLFLNVALGLANLYFGLAGHIVNLIVVAVNVVGAGLMLHILRRENWPHWLEQV